MAINLSQLGRSPRDDSRTRRAAQRLAKAVPEIVDGSVTTAKLGAGAVTEAKLADGAVTGSKLGIATTKGDILVHNGTTVVRLPVGADGQILYADSAEATGLRWGDAPVPTSSGFSNGFSSGFGT